MVYDDYSGALFAVAVATKEYEDWLAEYLKAITVELGYGGARIAIKHDNAPELIRLRTELTSRRGAPTVPITVPVKESKNNGAVERAVRTWQGQFRTLKDHAEFELKSELGPRHPLLTWCAWWAAALLNRVQVQPNGRTAYEMYSGHRAKTPIAAFGERIMWRTPRAVSGRGKFQTEWEYGVFIGVSGAEALIGDADGVHRSRDIRRMTDDECWEREAADACKMTFKQYLNPRLVPEEPFEIPVIPHPPGEDMPQTETGGTSRRMMLRPSDFRVHGYTGGCPGCISLQTENASHRRHNEACRKRMESEIVKTPEGKLRKDRESMRREAEFERVVGEEDKKQQQQQQQRQQQQQQSASTSEFTEASFQRRMREHNVEPNGPAWRALRQEFEESVKRYRDELIRERRADVDGEGGAPEPTTEQDENAGDDVPGHADVGGNGDDADDAADDEPETKKARTDSLSAMRSPARHVEGLPRPGRDISVVQCNKRIMPKLASEESDIDRRIVALMVRGCDVFELYSPERIGKACKKYGLAPGPALDLRTGFDFSTDKDRKRALKLYEDTQPELVTLSPPCTAFSRLQALNRHVHGEEYRLKHDEAIKEATKHIEFSIRLARMQMKRGKWFLFEHPAYAETWELPCMQRLLATPGVDWQIGDQCQYGLVTHDSEGREAPALKPTRFVSNAWCLLEELSKRCPRTHEHQALMGGRAAAAAEYPDGLCDAVCRGLVRQKEYQKTQCVETKRHGRAELKSLIRKIRLIGARPVAAERAKTQVGTTDMVGEIVRNDLMTVRDKTRKYQEERHLKSTLRNAREALTVKIGKSCLKRSDEGGIDKNVTFELNECLMSTTPEHWVDDFHEPDGTHPSLLVGAGITNRKAEETTRRDLEGPASLAASPMGFDQATSAAQPTSARSTAAEWYFHRGENIGEMLLLEHMKALTTRDGVTSCVDDVSGGALDEAGVRAARKLEMDYFLKMGVYEYVSREEATRSGKGKIIKGRWIDINKGDSKNPDYRSRFVGKEFNTGVDSSLYAATPPLEALKLLISGAASERRRGTHMMFSDVKRAYFNAPTNREIYVEVPREDPNWKPGLLGRLRLSLYGTRDAAANWQRCVSEHLVSIGFRPGRSNPCVFWHPEREIRALVHGDDYASTGDLKQLDWLRTELEKKFEMKTQIVGHSNRSDVIREAKILNRVVRANEEGWEYECDQRHVEIMLEQLGLTQAKPLGTPGVEETTDKKDGGTEVSKSPILSNEKASLYRAITARGNYVAQDRPDIQYAVKELCRRMSDPDEASWDKLVRLGRYLRGRPRAVSRFEWQTCPRTQDVFSDANWAGCRSSRKSTSGGAIRLGTHCVRTWSKTQNTIAQSSAESELLAIVRAATEALGCMSLAADLGWTFDTRLHVDAAAALGILERRGVGRIRHLDVGSLWLQEVQLRQKIEFVKVKGTSNPADLMTKHLPREGVNDCSQWLSYEFREGRSTTTAQLHATTPVRASIAPGKGEDGGKDNAKKTQREEAARTETDRTTVEHRTRVAAARAPDVSPRPLETEPRCRPSQAEYDKSPVPTGGNYKEAELVVRKGNFRNEPNYANECREVPQSLRSRRRQQRNGHWKEDGPGVMIARFRNARAHRLPPGLKWDNVVERVTVDANSEEVIEHVDEKVRPISAKDACRRLDRVRDIIVRVAYREIGDNHNDLNDHNDLNNFNDPNSASWDKVRCMKGQRWADASDEDTPAAGMRDDNSERINRPRLFMMKGKSSPVDCETSSESYGDEPTCAVGDVETSLVHTGAIIEQFGGGGINSDGMSRDWRDQDIREGNSVAGEERYVLNASNRNRRGSQSRRVTCRPAAFSLGRGGVQTHGSLCTCVVCSSLVCDCMCTDPIVCICNPFCSSDFLLNFQCAKTNNFILFVTWYAYLLVSFAW